MNLDLMLTLFLKILPSVQLRISLGSGGSSGLNLRIGISEAVSVVSWSEGR